MPRPTRQSLAVALVGAAVFTPRAAAAQAREAREADVVEAPTKDAWERTERAFLYTADPSAVPGGHVVASMGAAYAAVDRAAGRPFAADVAHGGAVFEAAAEVGIARFLSVEGQLLLAGGGEQGASRVAAGGVVGLTGRPLPARWPVTLAVSGGYLRELGGDNGAWGRAALAGDIGRVRLAGSAFAERIFAPGRDDLDLMLTAGASVLVASWARVGVEYVAQDLEGAWERDEVDGGIQHFVGPTAEIRLARRVRVLGGPALGLSAGAPTVLGRVQASYLF